MSHLFLETKDIINITGQRFYKRGLDYFNKGRVNSLSYNPTIHSWSAVVKGANHYNVRIFFFENDDLEATCNCPAYETHYTCKHIAAVLLAVTNKQQPAQIINDEATANGTDPFPLRMIDAFSEPVDPTVTETERLKIDFILNETRHSASQDPFFKLSLKVGEQQLFIVKDLQGFIQAIEYKQSIKITNNFAYQPQRHEINSADIHVLNLLKTVIAHANIYAHDYLDIDKREVVLPPFLFESFIKRLTLCSFQLTKETGEATNTLTIIDQLPEISFAIDLKTEQTYTIDFSQLFGYQFSRYYNYLYRDQHFYLLTDEQKDTLTQIYAILPYQQKKVYQISKDKMTYFVGHVLPHIKRLGTIKYSNEAQVTIKQFPLEVKLYIEEIKQALSVTVIFQYGDKQINPFEKQNPNDTVLIRAFKKEQHIIDLLKKSGFHYLNQRFQLFSYERIYQFIHEQLPLLQNEATVYLSEQAKTLKAEQQPSLATTVDHNAFTGMLDVHFNIDGISDDEIKNVLKALVERKKYYRLNNGPLIKLSDDAFQAFQTFADQLQLKQSELLDTHLQLNTAQSIQVDQALAGYQPNYSDTFHQLLEAIQQPQAINYRLPAALQAELRDYQKVGYQWFKALAQYQLGGILADEMGLGKTVQAISFIVSEKETDNRQPSLVIAPASLIYNWKYEFEKFAPTLAVEVVAGSKQERQSLFQSENTPDVLITSYPLIRKDIKNYQALNFDIMILDEAQAIKNHLTQTAKATKAIQAKQRFALSGTPIENRLDELWSIFQTISPGFLGPKRQFLQHDKDYIQQITRPFILRRLKRDVLPELPEKIEIEQYTELTKEQKQVYLAYLQRIQQHVDTAIENNQFEQGKLEILAGLTRLRQICCHPGLFLDNYHGQSGKLDLLLTIIEQLREQDRRILIFSQFSSMLKMIAQQVNKHDYQAFYLDGQTPVKDRVTMADQFNNGERELFLISLKAGGTGLNLTGADTVILYDLWWNPAVEAQAAGRAHRIGQKNNVEVIRLITKGTIEEKIFQLQEKKRELVDEIIQPGETLLSSLDKEEVKALLSFDR
ncbi:DEAD/DEAH box helicase [Amphibacillus cookii]|uniref:DEAD/DEAH box helicase n=1 Tax=Amphibacillus cookii TaxID=767787 RepID=UPI00195E0ACE|nr:DEAD/DEAH box helicase [Amphibacillus cookii]MBM7541539.1 SNF2 family DNA or RNA helicase [Amphibacillus cookii]